MPRLMYLDPNDGAYKPVPVGGTGTGGGGTGTGVGNRSALLVAASNAPAAIKDGADYVCDGSGDQVQINQALVDAAGKAEVRLSGGNFSISAPITITQSNSVLRGSGLGATSIRIGSGTNIDGIRVTGTGTVSVEIRDLYIDGNRGGNATGSGIVIDTPHQSTDTQHFLFNLDIAYTSTYGIHVVNGRAIRIYFTRVKWGDGDAYMIEGSDQHIVACIADGMGKSGFVISGGNTEVIGCKAFYCSDDLIAGTAGFRVEANRCFFTQCEAQDQYLDGFLLDACHECTFTGCIGDSNGQSAAGYSGMRFDSAYNNTVTGGIFFDRAVPGQTPQSYGITLAGTSRNNIISGEQYNGNASGTFRDITSPAQINYRPTSQFTSTRGGVVPSSGGGTTNYLRADGTWAAPSSGGLTLDAADQKYVHVANKTDPVATKGGQYSLSDPTNMRFIQADILDDGSDTATWPDRLQFRYRKVGGVSPVRTGGFNEYGEGRFDAAKGGTTALRVHGHTDDAGLADATAPIFCVRNKRGGTLDMMNVWLDRVEMAVPVYGVAPSQPGHFATKAYVDSVGGGGGGGATSGPWTAFVYQNSATDSTNPAGLAPGAWRLEPGGVVRLRGGVYHAAGISGMSSLVQLPVEARPGYVVIIAVRVGATNRQVQINTNGTVMCTSALAAADTMWLDGITFPAA